jgi:hypothetical protein
MKDNKHKKGILIIYVQLFVLLFTHILLIPDLDIIGIITIKVACRDTSNAVEHGNSLEKKSKIADFI